MNIEVIHPDELTSDLIQTWHEIRLAEGSLASPYFAPAFTKAVAKVRRDVRIGVIHDGAVVAGFLPFQRSSVGVGAPVGGRLSDYHGLIARASLEIDPQLLLEGCGLVSWDFDHLPTSQRWFADACSATAPSPTMDLTGGYDAYAKRIREGGSKQINKLGTLRRKFEREIGELTFTEHDTDPEALAQMREWKSAQCAAVGGADVFGVDWTVALVNELMATDEPGLRGVFSTLRFGDTLLAAHFGMRSERVWHYWFPAYDKQYASFSPGLLLLLEIAAACERCGVTTIDLGKGDDFYKQRVQTGAIEIAEGRIERGSAVGAIRRWMDAAEESTGGLSGLAGRAVSRYRRSRKFG